MRYNHLKHMAEGGSMAPEVKTATESEGEEASMNREVAPAEDEQHMPYCTLAEIAEHSRPFRDEEACDEGREGE
jgi:hypothetical protein